LEPATELDGERLQEQSDRLVVKNALLLRNYLLAYVHQTSTPTSACFDAAGCSEASIMTEAR
jgi:hypothetical protein